MLAVYMYQHGMKELELQYYIVQIDIHADFV